MRELWYECDGVRLFAVEDGEGPVIVMLHGAMANHQAALPPVASLSSRYRVVAPDIRGSGKSIYGGSLSFNRLAADIEILLDKLAVDRAFVGGVSSGTGVALRFAMRRPDRTFGLILITPVYAGEENGYSDQQMATFTGMNALASRAVEEGVQVLRPMYANLPSQIREKAIAIVEGFDPASIVATSHFIASGAQPFNSTTELRSIQPPTLLVRGDDALHPSEVSDLYVSNIPRCSEVSPHADLAASIGEFCDQHIQS